MISAGVTWEKVMLLYHVVGRHKMAEKRFRFFIIKAIFSMNLDLKLSCFTTDSFSVFDVRRQYNF